MNWQKYFLTDLIPMPFEFAQEYFIKETVVAHKHLCVEGFTFWPVHILTDMPVIAHFSYSHVGNVKHLWHN